MSPFTRFFFACFFLFWIIVFSLLLIAVCVVIWAFVSAAFAT